MPVVAGFLSGICPVANYPDGGGKQWIAPISRLPYHCKYVLQYVHFCRAYVHLAASLTLDPDLIGTICLLG